MSNIVCEISAKLALAAALALGVACTPEEQPKPSSTQNPCKNLPCSQGTWPYNPQTETPKAVRVIPPSTGAEHQGNKTSSGPSGGCGYQPCQSESQSGSALSSRADTSKHEQRVIPYEVWSELAKQGVRVCGGEENKVCAGAPSPAPPSPSSP